MGQKRDSGVPETGPIQVSELRGKLVYSETASAYVSKGRPDSRVFYVFTQADLAALMELNPRGLEQALRTKKFDPSDLKSVFEYWKERELNKARRALTEEYPFIGKRKNHRIEFGGMTFDFSLVEDELEDE